MRSLIGIALLLASGQASAANWLEINDGSDGTHASVDLTSIQRSGASRLAWLKVVDVTPQPSSGSTMIQDEINCTSRMIAHRQIVTYGSDGQLVDQKDLGSHPSSIIPDSLAEAEMHLVCR